MTKIVLAAVALALSAGTAAIAQPDRPMMHHHHMMMRHHGWMHGHHHGWRHHWRHHR